jgi:hypothetical protein
MAHPYNRRLFLVGTISGSNVTMWFLRATRAPIKGPWTLAQLSHTARAERHTA